METTISSYNQNRHSPGKKFLLRVMCFLTGYSYPLILESSDLSIKKLKQFFGGLVLVSTVWAFIGYTFTNRYLRLEAWWQGAIGAIIAILAVIKIERQIILNVRKTLGGSIIRLLIGLIIAMIGSITLDQFIFKDDIEKLKIEKNQDEVNKVFPKKSKEVDEQIAEIQKQLAKEKLEIDSINKILDKNPFIKKTSLSVNYDSTKKEKGRTISTEQEPNPLFRERDRKNIHIDTLEKRKNLLESQKLVLRQSLEKEIKEKQGFFDELKVFLAFVFDSWLSGVVWLIFFLFFLFIELLIVIVKWTNSKYSDYEIKILLQDHVKQKQVLNNLSLQDQEEFKKLYDIDKMFFVARVLHSLKSKLYNIIDKEKKK